MDLEALNTYCTVIRGKAFVYQGHSTDRLGILSVRKALNPLQCSEGNFHLELS